MIAIRESMEFDTTKAVVTAVLGLAVNIAANIMISILVGGISLIGSRIFG